MSDKIKLDIVSDVVCPWCIIGYKRLEQAIADLGAEDKVEIEWHPFELNPDMPAEGEDIRDHVARKYGSTPEEGLRSRESMTKLGKELGFTFDFFSGKRIVNTRDAHVLLDYAKEFGKQTELKMRLFEAYFSERKDISVRQVLTEELQQVGLDVEMALERLDKSETHKIVQAHEAFWQNLGVTAVPTVVINQSKALTGAQPVEIYKRVLAELIEEKATNQESIKRSA